MIGFELFEQTDEYSRYKKSGEIFYYLYQYNSGKYILEKCKNKYYGYFAEIIYEGEDKQELDKILCGLE